MVQLNGKLIRVLRFITHIFSPKFIASLVVLFHN
nr:MAG TPA: hypothetical protein [Caudoviricetes sp.]